MLGFVVFLDAPLGRGSSNESSTMRTLATTLAFLFALIVASLASAHALPDHSSPNAGARLSTAPKEVKIWFNGEIEPVFSTLIVKNAAGQQVSIGKGKVDASNHVRLETALSNDPLPGGIYTVDWRAVARDGHHTEGHFDFTVR
jgi:methionine-rich copper-binding protein CopC